MDIEKLIEQLNGYFEGKDLKRGVALDTATALSTLRAENEKLRDEVERQRRSADDRQHLYENAERAYMKVLAELEQVKRERDAAIEAANGLDKMIGRAWGKTDMERLTYFDGGKWRLRIGDTEYSGKAVDRLAAYEDTGLEPEDLKRAFNEDAVLKLAGQALGITPERLRELVQADNEGLCVVLPFKPPRWVYMCSARFPKPAKAHYASAINVLQDMDNGCVFGDTPKEAEDALRREQDG